MNPDLWHREAFYFLILYRPTLSPGGKHGHLKPFLAAFLYLFGIVMKIF